MNIFHLVKTCRVYTNDLGLFPLALFAGRQLDKLRQLFNVMKTIKNRGLIFRN